MIDIDVEALVSIREAPRHIPGTPHIATIFRWATRGVRGQQLETIVRGGRRYTSLEAIGRFIEATTAAAPGASQRQATPTTRQRAAAIAAAERELRGK